MVIFNLLFSIFGIFISIIVLCAIFYQTKDKIFDPDEKKEKEYIKQNICYVKSINFSFRHNHMFFHYKCPNCEEIFDTSSSEFKVYHRKIKPDIGYIECPECGQKIEISEYDVSLFDYHYDPVGNLVNKKSTLYSITCSKCEIDSIYQEADFNTSIDGEPLVRCKVENCHSIIHANKSNTRIIKRFNR